MFKAHGHTIFMVTGEANDKLHGANVKDANTLSTSIVNNMKSVTLYDPQETVHTFTILYGSVASYDYKSSDGLKILVDKNVDASKLKVSYSGSDTLKASVKKGQSIGQLTITYNGSTLTTVQLYALQSIPFSIFSFVTYYFLHYVLIGIVGIAILVLINKKRKLTKKPRRRYH